MGAPFATITNEGAVALYRNEGRDPASGRTESHFLVGMTANEARTLALELTLMADQSEATAQRLREERRVNLVRQRDAAIAALAVLDAQIAASSSTEPQEKTDGR